MNIISKNIAAFTAFISLSTYASSEEMMLGRIPEKGGEVLTLSHFTVSGLFILIALGLISQKAYQHILLKKALFLIGSIALLCLFVPTLSFLSVIPNFAHFQFSSIVLASITIAATIALAEEYFFYKSPLSSIIKKAITGSYISFITLTGLSFLLIPEISIAAVETLWISIIFASIFMGILPKLREKYDFNIFLYCIAPLFTGLLLAFGNKGSVSIISSAVGFIGWSMALGAAATMSFKLYKMFCPALAVSVKENTEKPSEKHMTLMLNVSENIITINDIFAKKIGLENAKRDYNIAHFKALIHQEYHDIFMNMLYENNPHQEGYILFHGIDTYYQLAPREHHYDNINNIIFDLQPVSEKNNALMQENEISTPYSHTETMYDHFVETINNTIFETTPPKGQFCLVVADIHNLEMLFLEGTHSEGKKAPETIIARLTKKIIHFNKLHIMQISATEFCIFFQSNDPEHDVQVAENMIKNICELPIKCSFGSFFPQIISAYSYMPAEDLQKNLSNNTFNQFFDMTNKKLLSKKLHINELLPDNTALPDRTTISGLASDLHYAPENGQLEPYFSPYVSLKTGIISGFYARPFWRHPDHGIINRNLLNFLSDYIGYEGIIGRMHVIMTIECFSKIILKHNMQNSFVRIPVSQAVLRGKFNITSEIATLIQKFNIVPSQIHLNLVDDCMIGNNDWLLPILKEMKLLGLTIVLDNYGNNAIKMAHLTDLPIDYVIIHNKFIKNVAYDERKKFALDNTLKLFHNLNIRTDINHVNVIDDLHILKQYDFENVMGDACGQEMSYGNLTAFITNGHKSKVNS